MEKKYEIGDFLIVLITDCKAIDSMQYEAKLNRVKNIKEFRDAIKRGCMDGLTFNPPIEYVDSSFNQPL